MTTVESLITDFNRDMQQILEREAEVEMYSSRFRQLIEQSDGYGAAKRLLSKGEPPPNTFTWLRNIRRLDLTMEFYVVQDKYRPIFTEDERTRAQWRLVQGD